MVSRTCSIPDCSDPVKARTWCRAHYLRWFKYGDPEAGGPRQKPTADRGCSVIGCDRHHFSNGYCGAHYQRWAKTGSAGGTDIQVRNPDAVCSVDMCDRKHYGKGLCTKHYQRMAKYGSTDVVGSPYRGDDVGYSAVHERLVRTRGSASMFSCVQCGRQASDWAYDGACPDERIGVRHGRALTYSTDPDRYMPLCRACHSAYDGNIPRKSRTA